MRMQWLATALQLLLEGRDCEPRSCTTELTIRMCCGDCLWSEQVMGCSMFQYACRNCCTAANRCILSCSNFERLPKRVYEHYFGAGNLDQAAGGAGEACELRFHLQFSGSSHHKSVVLSSLNEDPAELIATNHCILAISQA